MKVTVDNHLITIKKIYLLRTLLLSKIHRINKSYTLTGSSLQLVINEISVRKMCFSKALGDVVKM